MVNFLYLSDFVCTENIFKNDEMHTRAPVFITHKTTIIRVNIVNFQQTCFCTVINMYMYNIRETTVIRIIKDLRPLCSAQSYFPSSRRCFRRKIVLICFIIFTTNRFYTGLKSIYRVNSNVAFLDF